MIDKTKEILIISNLLSMDLFRNNKLAINFFNKILGKSTNWMCICVTTDSYRQEKERGLFSYTSI